MSVPIDAGAMISDFIQRLDASECWAINWTLILTRPVH